MVRERSQSNILLEVGTNELEIIIFYLDHIDSSTGQIKRNLFGINAAKVRELVALPSEITHLVNSPPCVKGVFLLRDKTIPLVDVSDYFAYKVETEEEVKRKWVVIVAELNGKRFGFITHGVDKVQRVSWTEINPPPEILSKDVAITGICLIDEQTIQMIDFERIAADIDPSMVMRYSGDVEDSEVLRSKFGNEVVIADDSTVVRSQIKKTLTSAGFDVIAHTDGQNAWDYLESRRQEETLDKKILAIISDIEMPRMDGHHFCRKVRAVQAYKDIPVILFSSLINDALRRKGESVGADDQVTKPELDTLVGRIEKCVSTLNPE